MKRNQISKVLLITSLFIHSCSKPPQEVDLLLSNGTIVNGLGEASFNGDIGILGDQIVFVGDADTATLKVKRIINVEGQIIAPGFIDPHTHSYGDLKNVDRNSNKNYLMQGVTTVITGNDGGSPSDIAAAYDTLTHNGIGTNVAFLIGHGTVRKQVLGNQNTAPDSLQLEAMKTLVQDAMTAGAFGLSSGLYYAPGSYATTEEVIELAKVAGSFGGVYDTHIRDESTYNIGLLAAVEEAIEIAEKADIALNLSHIKALGVDVWGQSKQVIELVAAAQKRGIKITADQYPWRASGTHLENAVINRWVMAGGDDDYLQRLNDPALLPRIKNEMKENIRKRGGPSSLLITADSKDTTMIGFTLEQLAVKHQTDPVEMALIICKNGGARVASFNMNEDDISNFMTQSWVMTSSDGTKGHPRKYASFPTKFYKYVKQEQVISLETFVRSSTDLVATTFGIPRRGRLAEGYFADLLVFDKDKYLPQADFSNPAVLTKGVDFLFVNGNLVIEDGNFNGALMGQVLRKDH